MRQHGRPVRGAVAGFFLGLFISLDLVIFGVFALDADALALFPVLGIAAGVALGLMAPLRRRPRTGEENPARSPALVEPGPGPSPA